MKALGQDKGLVKQGAMQAGVIRRARVANLGEDGFFVLKMLHDIGDEVIHQFAQFRRIRCHHHRAEKLVGINEELLMLRVDLRIAAFIGAAPDQLHQFAGSAA